MKITPMEAAAFHRRMKFRDGKFVAWTISAGTRDLGNRYVAKPLIIPISPEDNIDRFLIANSLDELRKQLPPGLTRIDRRPNDDPTVIEIWF